MLRRAFLQIGVPTVSRRNSRFLTVALMLWIGFGALGQAEAGGVLETPAGLKPGDQFRIVFATDGTTMATSTTITDYDKFVTNQAQGATYNGQTVQWLAIVSVEFTNAIDHIGESTYSNIFSKRNSSHDQYDSVGVVVRCAREPDLHRSQWPTCPRPDLDRHECRRSSSSRASPWRQRSDRRI